MKNRSPRRQSGRTDQLKEAIRTHYIRLQAEWVAELDAVKSDWTRLFDLHYRIAELERRAPWLKKEVA
jgi:hypothetical protein